MVEYPEYSPGLEGIIAGESAISRIDSERNRLLIRGYDLVDLTENVSFEEVAYLLLHTDLPSDSQLSDFGAQLRQQRDLTEEVLAILRSVPPFTHPMTLLRTAVSSLGHSDPDAGDDSHDANVRKAIRLLAKVPTILTTAHRLALGQTPVEPRADLDQAANLLYMLRGEEAQAYEAEAMNVSLILYAEHGFNASAFAARVTVSTLSNLYAAITSGIGALAGPLHGGANEAAMEMLLKVGSVENARPFALAAMASKAKIMGFGHREYKSGDSRVPIMKRVARQIAEATGNSLWPDVGDAIEETMIAEKGIHPNVDFPCAYAYYMMDIPIPLYTPIFVSSRISGWSAHVVEQLDNNRIIRPIHHYTGEAHRPYVPLKER